MNNDLHALGWCAFFQNQLDRNERIATDCVIGRVIEAQRELVLVATPSGDIWASLAGKLRHEIFRAADFPAVGDWVIARVPPGGDRGVIVRIFDRKSRFARREPTTGVEETIVTNVDLALVVAAAGHDLNLRRIERYLAMAWESGARPAVVITKSDLADDPEAIIADVASVSPGVRVVLTSAAERRGIEQVHALIRPGETAVLLGSSGAGKSTLVNALLGEEVQAVSRVSEHLQKGRHTTTARRLIAMKNGGMIIDTPGLRELALVDATEGVSATFEDVEQIAMRCRFSDCRHTNEPGCAIRAALDEGKLAYARYASYQKLQREAAYESRQSDPNLMRAERELWKKRSREGQANMKRKRLW